MTRISSVRNKGLGQLTAIPERLILIRAAKVLPQECAYVWRFLAATRESQRKPRSPSWEQYLERSDSAVLSTWFLLDVGGCAIFVLSSLPFFYYLQIPAKEGGRF